METINKIPGISSQTPSGAFYVFAGIKGLIDQEYFGKKITDSDVLGELLLEHAKVAMSREPVLEHLSISGFPMPPQWLI